MLTAVSKKQSHIKYYNSVLNQSLEGGSHRLHILKIRITIWQYQIRKQTSLKRLRQRLGSTLVDWGHPQMQTRPALSGYTAGEKSKLRKEYLLQC